MIDLNNRLKEEISKANAIVRFIHEEHVAKIEELEDKILTLTRKIESMEQEKVRFSEETDLATQMRKFSGIPDKIKKLTIEDIIKGDN
jgi:TolA-binding protein